MLLFFSRGWSRRASFDVTVVQIGEQEERLDTIRVRARYSVRALLFSVIWPFHYTLVPRAVNNCCFSNQLNCFMSRLYCIRDHKNSRYRNQSIFHCVVIYQSECPVSVFSGVQSQRFTQWRVILFPVVIVAETSWSLRSYDGCCNEQH